MKLAPTRPFPAVWGQRIAYCNVSALPVVATDIRGTLLASVPRVWSSPMCVWMRWAVTRAPKKACHEMSEKGPFWGQLKVKAPQLTALPTRSSTAVLPYELVRTKTESSLVHWQQPLRTLYVGQHSCLLYLLIPYELVSTTVPTWLDSHVRSS
jgi:hypothetical protein